MPNLHFFSSIDKVSIIGASCSAYLYSIYTFLPNYFYEPLITLFIPIIGVTSFLLLSKIKTLRATKGSQVVIQQNNLQDTVKEQNMDSQQNNIDESFIQAMIDQKISDALKVFSNQKQQLDDSINIINNVKMEVDELKKSVNELKNAFETTLVDIKSFQTEIANPLNFMRKYFESIDIKNFSDPLLPLQLENKANSINEEYSNEISNEHKDKIKDSKHDYNDEINNLASILNPSCDDMSLADTMRLISTLGEFIKIFGTNYHDVLSTQCKILGLSDEQKEKIFGIANVLSKSKTSADVYIETLYKLATLMGIKDEEMDAIYAKLKRKRKR